MPVHNDDIAVIFDEMADLLEIEEVNPFRVRAYRNAARTIRGLGQELSRMVAGTLDLPDSILSRLDLVIGAVHTGLGMSRDRQTRRILRAMDSKFFILLAHPGGRLLQERAPCELDMPRIIEAARERGCYLELNSQPQRLDLTDTYCQLAKDRGVLVCVNSDSHAATGFELLDYGISQARRGWLEKGDVLNTFPLRELRGRLRATMG